MSIETESAVSIRRRLLLFLVPSLLALMVAGVYANYRAAMLVVRAAYDERLGDAARAMAGRIAISRGESLIGPLPKSELTYLILGPGGRVLAGDPRLAAAPAGRSNPSYSDFDVAGQTLRVATYRRESGSGIVTVRTAELAVRRAAPRSFFLASTWLVDFIQFDVTLLLVWIAVHYGLKPLLAVRRQIEQRSPRELIALSTDAVPAEVRPLVDALNVLFDMLGEAARSQRRFVADTAHQLRTPIAGLMGHLELLMREPAAAPIRDRLAALHEGISRLAHSANQLLALARTDPTATLADGFEIVPLEKVVARAVELNVNRAAEGAHDLGAEAQPAVASANPRLLDDLLGNLIDNALSYTPAGGRITVRSGVADGGPFLEVEDDGPGIPAAERSRVLQRFYRIAGTRGHGCGLGLAIVDEIARTHGAHLLIADGTGGQGTRVRVRFPAPGVAQRSARGTAANGSAVQPETANDVPF